MDRRGVLLAAWCLCASSAWGAVSKCVDESGQVSYLQTRACPPPLRPLPYQAPALGRIEVVASPPAPRSRPKRTPARRADPMLGPCRRIKQRFRGTLTPCRGIDACRARQHLRQSLRKDYKAAFCAIRTGAIDS